MVPSKVKIGLSGGKGSGLYANNDISKDEIVFEFIGKKISGSEASVMALQIDDDLFLESTEGFDDNLNHSCDPNGKIFIDKDGRVFFKAIKNIAAGDELSFDYCTTEYDLVEQKCDFKCVCGSQNCRHEVKGFKYLSDEEKRRLKDFLIPYLYAKLQN